MTPLFGNAKGKTSFKLKEVHGLYINYLNGMMFRLQEQFEIDPKKTSLWKVNQIVSTPFLCLGSQ